MTANLTEKTKEILNNSKNKVIAVVGATASGKTAYAIELAKKINGEVVSADSRLVYKGFNIGCAKPSIEEQDGILHHMMDIVEPEHNYSAGLYETDAKKCIYEILKRGKVPVITGGTGLYFRVLLENYALPKIEPDYELRNELGKLTPEELHKKLYELDRQGALLIAPTDKKKLIRAIEIVKISGMPLLKARGQKNAEFEVEWIGRNFPRAELYDRINKRVDLMFENGIIDETKELLKRHGKIPNIIYTIGYQEVTAFLEGELSLEEAKERLKQNTRRYAKRQLTWFRKNKDINWNFYPETLKK